jgi:hypothetical protein
MGYVMNMQQIANSQDFQFRMAEFNRDVQSDLLNQQLWGQAGITLLNNLTQPGILFKPA